MIKLTKNQKEIVDAPERCISVVAGAGSGKTHVITQKMRKSLDDLRQGEKILAMTFSNKAADELRERLTQEIEERVIFEKTHIGTIHSFCNDVLMSHGHLIGIPSTIMLCTTDDDRLRILEEAIKYTPEIEHVLRQKSLKEQRKTMMDWLGSISKHKRELKSGVIDEKQEKIDLLFKEYNDQLINQGMMDFDDLIRYSYKILVGVPAVLRIYQRIYTEIYVDEAQDLNLAQYEIIKLLLGTKNKIIMVGDPNQSIYGFSGGSDIFFKTRFVEEYEVKTFELTENFRSSKSIIAAANRLEPNFNASGNYPIQGEFGIDSYVSEEKEAQGIAEQIKTLINEGHHDLEDGPLKLGSSAVIARNRYVFSPLIEELEKRGIKYSLKVSSRGTFSSESDVMRVFELGLILLGNKLDIIHRNELNDILKTTSLQEVSDIEKDTTIDETEKQKYRYVIAALDKISPTKDINLPPLLDHISEMFENKEICIEDNEREQIEQDISFWQSNWKSYERSSDMGMRNYESFIRRISLQSTYTEAQNAITLSTVHMSKGQEYDAVFIMGLNEGVFPDYRAIQASEKNEDELPLKEERQSLFVAITRARRICRLSYSQLRMMPWGARKAQSPSRFLEELDEKK